MTAIKKRSAKKVISLFFALLTIISCFSLTHLDAHAAQWTTGCFAGGKSYTAGTRVALNNKKKDAYVHLYTYKNNKACQSQIDILMKDKNGRTIWSGTKTVPKGGLKLKLGKDNSVYILYFRVHSPNIDVVNNMDEWNPKNKTPDCWGIKYSTNCSK